MGNNDHSSVFTDVVHIPHDGVFRFVIQSTGCLVQNQDSRVSNQRTSDSYTLSLATRQARTLLANHGVVTLWKFAYEVMSASQAGGCNDSLHCDARTGQRNVFSDAAVKQNVFLLHDANLAAQGSWVNQGNIMAINQYLPLFGYVEPLKKASKRALTRS